MASAKDSYESLPDGPVTREASGNAPAAPPPQPSEAIGVPVQPTNSVHPNPYVQPSPAVPHPGVLNSIKNTVDDVGKKFEASAKTIWRHFLAPSTAPPIYPSVAGGSSSFTATTIGKLDNIHLALGGNAETFWRRQFSPVPGEAFVNYFSCHSAAPTGLIVGTIFVSTLKLNFISDRPIEYITPAGTLAGNFYKLEIPLVRIADVIKTSHQASRDMKYLFIRTVDNLDIWFTNFLSFDLAADVIQWASGQAVQLAANQVLPPQHFTVPEPAREVETPPPSAEEKKEEDKNESKVNEIPKGKNP